MAPDENRPPIERQGSIGTAVGGRSPAYVRRHPALTLLALALFLGGVVAFFVSVFGEPDIPGLQKLGNELISQIEAHRAKHGSYPASLEAAGLRAPATRTATFIYHVSTDGQRFEIWIRDGSFTIGRSSRDNAWWVDSG